LLDLCNSGRQGRSIRNVELEDKRRSTDRLKFSKHMAILLFVARQHRNRRTRASQTKCKAAPDDSGVPRLGRSRSSRALMTGQLRCSMQCWIAIHLGEEACDSVRSYRHADRCEQLADEA
jgi:hypothetical protein